METIEWIRNPNLKPGGCSDAMVFVSIVGTIFKQARTSDPDRVNDHQTAKCDGEVRDLLTYLLLRRHPVTNDDVRPDFPINPNVVLPEKIDLLKSASQRMIERYINSDYEHAKPYPILQLLQETSVNHGANWYNGAEVACLLLAMWLFTCRVDTEEILTKRMCLKLYYESISFPTDMCAKEFFFDKMNIKFRVSAEIDRLCDSSFTNDEMLRELSYIGAFVSLVRSARMMGQEDPINQTLRNEVAWLQSTR